MNTAIPSPVCGDILVETDRLNGDVHVRFAKVMRVTNSGRYGVRYLNQIRTKTEKRLEGFFSFKRPMLDDDVLDDHVILSDQPDRTELFPRLKHSWRYCYEIWDLKKNTTTSWIVAYEPMNRKVIVSYLSALSLT